MRQASQKAQLSLILGLKLKLKKLAKWMAEKFQADVVVWESTQQTAGLAPAESMKCPK